MHHTAQDRREQAEKSFSANLPRSSVLLPHGEVASVVEEIVSEAKAYILNKTNNNISFTSTSKKNNSKSY